MLHNQPSVWQYFDESPCILVFAAFVVLDLAYKNTYRQKMNAAPGSYTRVFL